MDLNVHGSGYMVYIDESGQYKQVDSNDDYKGNSWYVHSAVMIAINDWLHIENIFNEANDKFGFPNNFEVKWSYLFATESMRKKQIKKVEAVGNYEPPVYREYVSWIFSQLINIKSFKLFFTVTRNYSIRLKSHWTPDRIDEMHIEDIVSRINKSLKGTHSTSIFIVDQKNVRKNSSYSKIINSFYDYKSSKPFNEELKHIFPSVCLAHSDHCRGLQIADYCAGAFNNALKGKYDSQYLIYRLFDKIHNYDTKMMGRGVIEVPTCECTRKEIEKILNDSVKISRNTISWFDEDLDDVGFALSEGYTKRQVLEMGNDRDLL